MLSGYPHNKTGKLALEVNTCHRRLIRELLTSLLYHWRTTSIVVAGGVLLALLPPTQVANAATPLRNVLILYSYNDELPWQKTVRKGLQERLALQKDASAFNVFEERLDINRLKPGARESVWLQYLQKKYASIQLDMVITESTYAAQFLIHHPQLFDSAKHYLVDSGPITVADNVTKTMIFREDVETAVRTALDLRPNARKLIVIGNLNPARVTRAHEMWQAHFKDRVAYEAWTDDFSFEELYQHAAKLPPDAVILYALVNKDRTGARAIPFDILQKLAARASVPVFTTHDTLLGSGTVGGYLLSAERVGWAIADLIAGADPTQFSESFFSAYEFDARALARWGIEDTQLPVGSTIQFREVSFWQQYRVALIALILFLVGETTLLLTLARALKAKRVAQAQLEARVEERTAELKAANQRLADMSSMDELTKLANRRNFNQKLNAEFLRHKRTRAPISLIMLDVDYFKNYNDSYGHVAGDECLLQLANVIAATVNRPTDLVARYGGEEFAILLPETTAAGARNVAERIHAEIDKLCLPHPDSNVAKHVTVSVGVITAPVSGIESMMDLVKLADEQLYRAKTTGRNRISGNDLMQTETPGDQRKRQ